MSHQLLNSPVLVLSKYFIAVQVTIAKDAITALVTGKAEVIDENYSRHDLDSWINYSLPGDLEGKYEGVIHSPSIQILVPQVIRFADCEYTSPLIKTIKYSRRNVYVRDNYECQYCFNQRIECKDLETKVKNVLTLDHIIPKSRGGQSNWANIVTSCKWCNRDKGNKLLEELEWELKKKPTTPRWTSHTKTPFNKIKKKYWEKFLQ